MQFWILSISLLAFGTIGVHSLQCYDCSGDECNNINDDMLHDCGQDITTPTTTTKKSTPTTTSTQSTSVVPTPPAPTSSPITENTSSSLPSTVGSTTTTRTTSETTENTRSSPPSTTDTTMTTTVSTTSLPTETTISTEETSPSTNKLAQSLRQRRSLIMKPKIQPSDVLLTNYRLSSNNTRADSSYFCYSASIPDGDSSKRKHGCVEVAAGKDSCDAVRELNSIPSNTDINYGCWTCQTDKCNNGAEHLEGISVLMLLMALIVQKFCK